MTEFNHYFSFKYENSGLLFPSLLFVKALFLQIQQSFDDEKCCISLSEKTMPVFNMKIL